MFGNLGRNPAWVLPTGSGKLWDVLRVLPATLPHISDITTTYAITGCTIEPFQ